MKLRGFCGRAVFGALILLLASAFSAVDTGNGVFVPGNGPISIALPAAGNAPAPQVQFDANATQFTQIFTGTTATLNTLTVGSHPNGALVIQTLAQVDPSLAAPTLVSATWTVGGVTQDLKFVVNYPVDVDISNEFWVLTDPTPGNGTLTATWNEDVGSTGQGGADLNATSFYNVDQTNPTYLPNIWTTPVTISEAAPAVFTLASNNLFGEEPFYLTTTGVLPAPLQPNTIYYVNPPLSSTTFNAVFEAAAGDTITTTTTGSGVHTLHQLPYVRDVFANTSSVTSSFPAIGNPGDMVVESYKFSADSFSSFAPENPKQTVTYADIFGSGGSWVPAGTPIGTIAQGTNIGFWWEFAIVLKAAS